MKRIRTHELLLGGGLITVVLGAALGGCGDEAHHEVAKLRTVRWEGVSTADGGRTRTFAGVTRAGQEIVLSFKVSGTIEDLPVDLGDRVEAGDVIAVIDSRDYRLQADEAQASLRRAEAQLRNARAEYKRAEALYEADNASLADLEATRATFETAEAGVTASQNSLELALRQLEYTRLTAPVPGAIARRPVEENENVRAGQEVALLTAGDRAEVEVFMPGQLVGGLRVGDPAIVTVSAQPDRPLAAEVVGIGAAATGGGSTFPVTVRLVEPDVGVLPGLSAEVALTFDDGDTVGRFLVPASAVGEDATGRYALVVRDLEAGQGTAMRVAVTTGDLTGLGLEVLAGLQDGDVLITAGVHRIQDGQRVLVPQP